MKILNCDELRGLLENSKERNNAFFAFNIHDFLWINASVIASANSNLPLIVQVSRNASDLIGGGDFLVGF